MVLTVETPAEIIPGYEGISYPLVFTEVRKDEGKLAYTAVIGEKLHRDYNTKAITALEADLVTGGLYILSLSPHDLSSRAYSGIAGFESEDNIYFAVVFPDWSIPDKLEPASRWKFRYVSFEYPRGGKKGFLLPTINTSPFAYCFITKQQSQLIKHLCPPKPIASYAPEEFGYTKGKLLSYFKSPRVRQKHADELYPIIDNIFEQSKGNINQYIPMNKQLIPRQYRDYQMLYNADSLWDW